MALYLITDSAGTTVGVCDSAVKAHKALKEHADSFIGNVNICLSFIEKPNTMDEYMYVQKRSVGAAGCGGLAVIKVNKVNKLV